MAGAPAGAPSAGGRPAGARDRGDPCREPAALRQPPDSRRTGGPRLPDESQAGGAPDAGPWVGRPPPSPIPGDDATHSRHPFPIAPKVLARQFERAAPDQAWVTDITYIPTDEGWLYLAVILDLCSRFAVGWAMSERITDALTLDALGLALARRRPPPGLLHHSDRGSQYASGDYQRVLAQHGMVCSRSRRGDCWDNAVAESFFATLKVELVHDAAWATRAAARTALFDYLELFYNGQRRHSALGYLSPRAFEQQREQEAVAT